MGKKLNFAYNSTDLKNFILWENVIKYIVRAVNILNSMDRNFCRTKIAFYFSLFFGVVLFAMISVAPQAARAQATVDELVADDFWAQIRTDTPRYTMDSFLFASSALEKSVSKYMENPSLELQADIALLSDVLVDLIDLDSVPVATRRQTGIRTFEYLMDIFGRIGKPDTLAFPDLDTLAKTDADGFRIPQTPLRIERVKEGPRKGEFLFADDTIRVAPRFYAAVSHLPLKTALDIESWTNFGPQQTGPLVPPEVMQLVPEMLHDIWLETPAWKVIFQVVLLAAVVIAILGIHRLVRSRVRSGRISILLAKTLAPVLLVYSTSSLLPFIALQVHLSGTFARFYDVTLTVVTYGALAFIFWLAVRALVEAIILFPHIPDESLDADLLRLGGATLGVFGAVFILALAGQAVGLPVLSMVAGLGIGGLAVALAVRPTFENLIGGVILFVDRPVRVGDFCSVGDQKGTVEGIGIRSTKLRGLDRTVISIPNAQFADMQIINWAQCDQMLIKETIGLRYDTTDDQLRYLLVELRRMLHAHPRIDGDTVRVRFSGFGDSSLKVDIRVYAQTREWNDFYAVREDIDLRILKAVREAGTDFAFPSQTVYMAKDTGRDNALSIRAEAAVQRWRESGQLPFPRLTRSELDRLEGTLDYPPSGSPDAGEEKKIDPEVAEPLSNPPEENSAELSK